MPASTPLTVLCVASYFKGTELNAIVRAAYNDPEIVWRLNKDRHVGLFVRSKDWQRIQRLP